MAIIESIGISNPEYKMKQMELADTIKHILDLDIRNAKILDAIFLSSGILTRYSVIQDFIKKPEEFTFFPKDRKHPLPSTSARMKIHEDNALSLSLKAVEDCFVKIENFNKNKITHIITVSCTGMYSPGIDIELIHKLELPSNINRAAINFMGCYGAINGLKLADAICQADKEAVVLLVAIELCTLHLQKDTAMDKLIGSALFGDGAAAMIISNNLQSKKSFLTRGAEISGACPRDG
jgi:predicted naringenin-chalcone synthase